MLANGAKETTTTTGTGTVTLSAGRLLSAAGGRTITLSPR